MLTALAIVALAGPARAEMDCKKRGNVVNCQSSGNLAPTQNRGCIKVEEADASMSPADLAVSVVACAKARKANTAADLYILMDARARFDAERVADKTAHQAGQVLMITIGSALSKAQTKALQDAMMQLLVDRSKPDYARLCKQIAKHGVPRHDPSYMISHGMGAVLGKDDGPLVANFNAKAAWKMVLYRYMKCPK